MKTFNDLVFGTHPRGVGKQAIMEFDNGHKISVVGGEAMGLYGDGITTWEIWRSCDVDVKGYLTSGEVTEQMIELQQMSSEVEHVGY